MQALYLYLVYQSKLLPNLILHLNICFLCSCAGEQAFHVYELGSIVRGRL